MPAAVWRKHRMGQLSLDSATLLVRTFEADLAGAAASALAARDADPECSVFAVFDSELRTAAAQNGFSLRT